MAITTYNGFVTSGSTFSDVISDSSSDTTWYKIWNEDTGDYYTTGATDTTESWVSADSLSQMELPNDQNNFYIKSYGPNSGQGDWTDFTVSIGNKDSYVEISNPTLDAETLYTYNEVIDASNLDSDAYLRVYNADEGEYVGDSDWIKADDLADYSFTTGADGEVSQIWVDTYLYNSGRSGWENAKVTAEDPIPPTPGETYPLTAGTDDFTGTSDDDSFEAPLSQNASAGGVSNTLSSADQLDGKAGNDTLNAELVTEFVGSDTGYNIDVQPTTTSIEDVNIEARDFSDVGGNVVTLDAKNMTGIDEIGSYMSDGDLTIENLTTLTDNGEARNTSELTITMDHTDNFNSDGDASDLDVYFDEDYLLNDEATSGAELEIRLLNAVQNEAGNNPIEGFSEITFTVGGEEVSTDITSIANDDTLDYTTAYDQVVDAINAQLAADGFDTVTAERAPIEDAVFSIPVAGFATGDDAGDYYPILVTNTGPEDLAGVDIGTSALSYDTDLNNSFDATDPETTENPVSVNIELEKAGRDGEGGDLTVGGKDQNLNGDTDVDQADGIELFDITVLGGEDKPSNLGQISSTNAELDTVNIASAEPGQDSEGQPTYADLTVRDQLGAGQELTEIDATDFKGDFSLAANGAQQVVTASFGGGDDYMSWESIEADGVSSDKDYSLSMGGGNDTLDADLDGDSVDAYGESFSVAMGSGDDVLNLTMDNVEDVYNVSQQTMADLHNNPGDYLEIGTDGGEDEVNLDAYGNFNIETGSSSDFVRINSEDENGNANTGEWVFGPATSGLDTFGDRVLYQAQLTVSFAGFESTVDVDTDSQGNFVADQMTVNEAIMAAIDANPELTQLLDYELGTDSQQLTVESLVGGQNDLAIALYQPEVLASDTDDADLDPGQVKVSSGNLDALRQGLIDTTANDSADLELESDIIAAIDNGSINQNGIGDGVTYANITHDTVLDGVDDSNAAPDQDIFDLAGADLYQDYINGGSTDSTTGVNFSTIDVGDGSNDIVAMHSNNDISSNILRISEDFGKVSVLNFHDVPTDAVDSYTDVANHALDFTTYLTNQDDPSDVPADNTQSVVDVPVTLNIVDGAEAFGDSGANPNATNNNDAVANGVDVLRFDEDVSDPDDLQTFDNLTADILLEALNDSDDDGSTDYGNLDQGLLTPADFGGNDLQSSTQQHIVMVENDENEGEYKVFHLTSSVDGDGNVDEESEGGVNQFASADELGTLDFGASINFNLVGSDDYTTLRSNLMEEADGGDTTPPELESTTPEDNATGIAVGDDLTMTFDEDVDAGPGNIALFDVTAGNQPVPVQTEFTGDTVTIDPVNDLNPDNNYFVRVQDGAIVDTAGNAYEGFAAPTAWNFTTVGTEAPTLDTTTPADDATDVNVGSNLTMTFDETVEAGTGTIDIIYAADDAVAEQIDVTSDQVTISDTTVTIDPSSDLDAGTDYYISIAQGSIVDTDGNPYSGISDDTTWNFTTADGGGGTTVDPVTEADSPYDAGTEDVTYVFPESGMNVEINNFDSGDVLDLPDLDNASLTNTSFSDGEVDVEWHDAGVDIIATLGVSNAADGNLASIGDMNTEFGAGTVI